MVGSSEPQNPGGRVYICVCMRIWRRAEARGGGVTYTYTDMVISHHHRQRAGEREAGRKRERERAAGQGQAGGDGARRVRGGRQPLACWLRLACQAIAACASVSPPPPRRPRACLGCYPIRFMDPGARLIWILVSVLSICLRCIRLRKILSRTPA